MSRRAFALLALVAAALFCGRPAPVAATTVVPVSDAELVRGATAIVVARVTGIRSLPGPGGRHVVTDVTISVDEVLAGSLPTRTLRVRIPGGRLGGIEMRVHGAPEFRVGERAVVFLEVGRDGLLRVAHLLQGKWSVVFDGLSGEEIAVRTVPDGVRVLSARAEAAATTLGPRDVRRLADFRRLAAQLRSRDGIAASSAAVTTGVVQTSEAFTFIGPAARWFEPDYGMTIPVVVDPAGDPAAPGRGFPQVIEAAQAWSNIPGSAAAVSVQVAPGPLDFAFDGTNAILFRDPSGVISPPFRCRGTLAVTVVYAETAETTSVRGRTFARILEADIVVADGWDGCDVYENHANLSEVIAHEMGHLLGLGHSADPTATMAAVAHFDGRGDSPTTLLADDDRAGAVFLYPEWATVSVSTVDGGGTVSFTPRGVTCGVDCVGFLPGTVVTATAIPRPGYEFVEWAASPGCGVATTCRFTAAGSDQILRARFRFGLALAVTAPAAGDVRGLTTVSLSATGGTGYSYRVSLNGATLYSGVSPSFTWDTTRFPDGDRILAATVTDVRGRRATATLPVRIANGATYIATLMSPAQGATIRGTTSIMMTTTARLGDAKTFTLYADDVPIFAMTTIATSLQLRWDSTRVPNGGRVLRLAVSRGSETATALRNVTLANPPLTAAFTAPATDTVGGRTTIRVTAATTSTPVTFAFTLDGVEVSRQTVAGTSAAVAWDTTATPNGPHTVAVNVSDAGGRTVTVTRTVTVANTYTAGFTAPASGALVRRTVSVGMNTTAPNGRTKTFTLAIGTQVLSSQTVAGTTARYSFDTRTVPNGAHTLTMTMTYNGQTVTATRPITVAN